MIFFFFFFVGICINDLHGDDVKTALNLQRWVWLVPPASRGGPGPRLFVHQTCTFPKVILVRGLTPLRGRPRGPRLFPDLVEGRVGAATSRPGLPGPRPRRPRPPQPGHDVPISRERMARRHVDPSNLGKMSDKS